MTGCQESGYTKNKASTLFQAGRVGCGNAIIR